MDGCNLGPECIRQLSLTLRGFNTSLKRINLTNNEIVDGQLVILALHMHPQLEQLHLGRMEIGRNECTTLSTLLQNITKQLHTLNLDGNDIDDEGVEALTGAISGSKLQVLNLLYNRSITIRGWKALSSLLEMPNSNLERLILSHNNIGDEGALFFANALMSNSELKVLTLHDNDITAEGWAHFSKLLCNTSSINKTYLSNHTLEDLGRDHWGIPDDVRSYLVLNRDSEDKGHVAVTKILQHHSHFNVQPFFEWEFKVLPLMISWLEKARARTSNFEEKIGRMKLSITYDFVREFPMLYIEPVTRKEIEDCSAFEKQLQGVQSQQAKLEEVLQRKTRALRRLW